jgi:hypothetical protein
MPAVPKAPEEMYVTADAGKKRKASKGDPKDSKRAKKDKGSKKVNKSRPLVVT